MKSVFISILIPTYNSESTILHLLDSISADEKVEIIINDDGSSDNTTKVCEDWKNKLNKTSFKIIKSNHSGVSLSRKKLIQNATGEYILFADSDDLLDSEGLAKAIAFLKQNRCDLLNSPYVLIIDGKNKHIGNISNTLDNFIFNLVCKANENMLWNKIIRRSIIESAVFNKNVENGEDKIALLSICKSIKKYLTIDSYFAKHIISYNSITSSKPNINILKRLIHYYDVLQPILLENGCASLGENIYLFWETLALYCYKVDKHFLNSKETKKDFKTIRNSSWYKYYKENGKNVRKKLPLRYKMLLFLHRL